MRILLVEDDEYKASDLMRAIDRVFQASDVSRAASVTSALRAIASSSFDLVVLDMSLPTFDISGPGGGGSPEGQGGVEVLRLASRLRNNSPFVVVTQYPDIEINGKDVQLIKSASELSNSFNINVIDCILYEFDGNKWNAQFTEALSGLRELN